jgi:hypothetical protein
VGDNMLLNYHEVKQKPNVLIAMTGLTAEEFEKLVILFQEAWDQERKYKGGRKPTILSTIEDKLFFILFYLKTYPLQEVIAYFFDITQGQANEWIHRLSKTLKKALQNGGCLPERVSKMLADRLSQESEHEFAIDGTERRIQRPQDTQKQKDYYSGKKRAHTVKNNLIAGLKDRKIKYLSGTYEGKKNDKKICDEEQYHFPKGTHLHQDKGFQGYQPKGVIVHQPKKKPGGKLLSEKEKQHNKLLASTRVVIEHVIAGIKRCRIIKDIFRNTMTGYADLVMEVACGLHNFRTECRC